MKKTPVLCVQRDAVNHGFNLPDKSMNLVYFDLDTIKSDDLHFIGRSIVDGKSPELLAIGQAFPQVLPYAVIRCGDEYLSYSRAKGNEDRLHGSLSIGFGGHIEMADMPNDNINLAKGLLRELEEEVGLDMQMPFQLDDTKSLLIDTTNDVGSVHLGILYMLEIDDKAMLNPDNGEIHLPEWQTLEQLVANSSQYENWSQLVIDALR